MNLARFLSPKCIRLEADSLPPEGEPEEITKRDWQEYRESLIKENADLLNRSGKVQNPSKLRQELLNREKRSTSIIGSGIAMPHVRTLQAKSFAMGFLRVSQGADMDASGEEEPVKIFIPMIAPPYDDKIYLRVYKQLAKGFIEFNAADRLLEAYSESEIIRIFNEVFR